MVKVERKGTDQKRIEALKKRPKKKTGRPKVYDGDTERLYVRLTPELADQVRAEATKQKRSASAQLALIVEDFFAKG